VPVMVCADAAPHNANTPNSAPTMLVILSGVTPLGGTRELEGWCRGDQSGSGCAALVGVVSKGRFCAPTHEIG